MAPCLILLYHDFFYSGASFHMTSDASLLTTIDVLSVFLGYTVSVASKLCLNFIFVSCLCSSRLIVSFYFDASVMQDPHMGYMDGTGSRQGNLYHFDCLHVSSSAASMASSTCLSISSNVELWHRRFGRVSGQTLEKLIQSHAPDHIRPSPSLL